MWKYTQPGMGALVVFVYGSGGAGAGFVIGVGLSWWVWWKMRQRWRDVGQRIERLGTG